MKKVKEVVVSIPEFRITSTQAEKKGQILNELFYEYYMCLSVISKNAIVSGKVKDALDVYLSYVESLINITDVMGRKCNYLCERYVERIDSASSYLYDGAADSFIRDFSQDSYERLIHVVKNSSFSWTSDLDDIQDWFFGLLIKLGCYDISDADTNIEKCHKRLLDYDDATVETINSIFGAVEIVDGEYVRPFENIYNALANIQEILVMMGEIIDPNKGLFKADIIQTKLSQLFVSLEKHVDAIVEISDPGVDVTIGEIQRFTEKELNIHFFSDHSKCIEEWIDKEQEYYEKYIAAIYNMPVQLMENITKQFGVPEEIEFKDVFRYLIAKETFAEIVSDAANTNINFDEATTEYQAAKEMIDLILAGEKLPIKYEPYKQFIEDLFEKVGDVNKWAERGVNVIEEIITPLLANNLKSDAVLSSVSGEFPKDSIYAIAAEELTFEYQHQILGTIDSILDYALEELTEEVIDKTAEFTEDLVKRIIGDSASHLTIAIKGGFEAAGSVHGITDAAQAWTEILCLSEINESMEAAYRKNFEKVSNGDTSEAALNDLQYSFNMMKNLYSKEYEIIATYEDGLGNPTRRDYYRYMSQRMKDTYMTSQTNGYITFEQFKKQY